MTHSHSEIRCASLVCERTSDANRDARNQLPGTKWRLALAAIASAPLRLHRYRNFHAEVVEDALRAFDCGKCS